MSKLEFIDQIVIKHNEAAQLGFWDGRSDSLYFQSCRHIAYLAGVTSLFTRDVGYHSSGWWKNPDYERCYHLSLSFFDPSTYEPRPRDKVISDRFVKAIYGHHFRWLWCEPPYSPTGKRSDVWHYRLFCDAAWQPIKPRGEVYSRELTEAGWLSFSDVQDQDRKRRELQRDRERYESKKRKGVK